jgi:hypothetical protein
MENVFSWPPVANTNSRSRRLLPGINAFLSFVNRVVDLVNRSLAITTFVGSGVLEIGFRLPQMIKRSPHVRLVRSDRRIENFTEQVLRMIIVAAVEGYSLIDVSDCSVHVFNCFHAMATFVGEGRLELRSGLLQISARSFHVRLIREGDGG